MDFQTATNRPHEKLEVWQEAMDLVVSIYAFTRTFPKHEQFGLAQQMQKASVSIPSNIAEGAARHGSKDFYRFLSIARGSLAELETQLQIASRIGYSQDKTLVQHCNKLFIKLSTLMKQVKLKSTAVV
jgi:four helix bundle protein